MKKILLWIGVLPISVLSILLISFIFPITFRWSLSRVIEPGELDWLLEYIIPWATNITAGVAYIMTGFTIAPSNKKMTALILFLIMLLLFGMYFFIKGSNQTIIIGSIANIIGSGGTLYYLRNEVK